MFIKINLINNITKNTFTNGFFYLDISFDKSYTIIMSVKINKNFNIKINDNEYTLDSGIPYNFIVHTTDKINLLISRLHNEIIINEDIEYIYVHEYGRPYKISNYKYQLVYSFDEKYFVGAFASIYSLIFNTGKINLNDININIIIPKNDIYVFLKKYSKLIEKMNYSPNISVYLVDNDIVPKNIISTTCFKGGNHLLKLSNFCRLLIGHLINCDSILYIDSDTIIQKDITHIFNKLNSDYVIMGNKSNLTYNNILNSNNKNKILTKINDKSLFEKNIIYTGTLIINPVKLRENFNNMIEIVNLHNSLIEMGGLYKLFTMSIINLGLYGKISFYNNILTNVVDLGNNLNLSHEIIQNADILDWSGIYKPWFTNGMYQEYWKKYNLLFEIKDIVTINKNTVESFE
jgi:lipopolysaccharide biosynthesis glycosyltransferase